MHGAADGPCEEDVYQEVGKEGGTVREEDRLHEEETAIEVRPRRSSKRNNLN